MTATRTKLEETMIATKNMADVAARHIAELAAAGDVTSTEFHSHLDMYRKLTDEFNDARAEYDRHLAPR